MKKLMFFTLLLLTFVLPSVLSAAPYGTGAYGSCEYGDGGCFITISTTGLVELSLAPAGGAVVTVAKDDVTVTTNSNSGYELRLESSSATENSLVNGGEDIPTTSATAGSPATLAVNEWGYRLDGELGFGAGPTSAVTNQSSSSLTFAGIPLLGAAQLIKTTATSAPTGDTTAVWYGAHVDVTKPQGTYTQTVLYTAVLAP